jgi:DNA ligase D-like protein (predicted 3'-phosphoesterase)
MPRFVIQQHHATSMHWDFRLEVGGTFKSWAVPKGPSTNPRDKRLAMAVDDHSIGWGDFEGVIGEGEYGAGPVIVWDRGTYENLRDEPMEDALAAGHASFALEGEKLHGGWSLRRTDGRRWLLIKRRDEFADTGDPVAERPESVVSGRTIEGRALRPPKGAKMPPRGVKKGTKRARQYERSRRARSSRGAPRSGPRRSPPAPSTRSAHAAASRAPARAARPRTCRRAAAAASAPAPAGRRGARAISSTTRPRS